MTRNLPLDANLLLSPRLWRLHGSARRSSLSWQVFFLGVTLIVLLAAGGLMYVRQITSTTASRYGVSALERRAEELRKEETTLEFEAAELESLKRIEERLPKLNLVPADVVAYTSPLIGGAVTGQIPVGTARQ